MGSGVLDIILFAVIAAFFVFRLRSVLGRRTGNERPPSEVFGSRGGQDNGNVVKLPDRSRDDTVSEDGLSELEQGVAQIRSVDESFDPAGFADGAKIAFEMIVTSFANGDKDTLRPLLNDEVYRDFSRAIDTREEIGETLESTFVGIRKSEILAAELQGTMASVTVKFVSDQINIVRDADGNVIEGDSNHVEEITDIWTFARNTRSRDPNWLLVATQSPQ